MPTHNQIVRTTSPDHGKTYPEVQIGILGRAQNTVQITPYGFYVHVPDGVLQALLGDGIALPLTAARPTDIEQGEIVFYHPVSMASVHMKNDGSINITAQSGDDPAHLNVLCGGVTIQVSGDERVTIGGDASIAIDGDASIAVDGNVTLSAAQVDVDAEQINLGQGGAPIARVGDAVQTSGGSGTIVSGGSNTSI